MKVFLIIGYISTLKFATPFSERKRDLVVDQSKVIKGSPFGWYGAYFEETFDDLD